MKLIDVEDAICIVDCIDTWQAGWRDKAIERLKALPFAQPEPKWIDGCECSVCHWINEDDGGDTLLTYYNYCPICGSKMGMNRNETL